MILFFVDRGVKEQGSRHLLIRFYTTSLRVFRVEHNDLIALAHGHACMHAMHGVWRGVCVLAQIHQVRQQTCRRRQECFMRVRTVRAAHRARTGLWAH